MLEDRMKSLEEAIRENTAALLGEKPKATKADKEDAAEAPARRSRAAKEDKEDEAPARRSRASKEDKEEKPKGKGKAKEYTIDDVRAAYADYLGPKDGKDYDDNSEFVEAVLDEVGADTLRQIKEEDFAKVMHWLDLKLDGKKKINFDADLPEDAAEEEAPRRRRSRVD